MATSRPQWVFWSGVRSQSHVMYAATWLASLLERTSGPVTVVRMDRGGFLGHDPVSDADLDRLLPSDPRLSRRSVDETGLRGPSGHDLTYLAVGSPGLKPWARLRAANPTRRLRVVVTDEGLGSYGTWQSRRDAWRREGGQEPWTTVRALATWSARGLLTSERWATYERTAEGWALNAAAADHIRASVQPEPSQTVAFLSQPWVELGLVSEAEQVAQVAEVAQATEALGFSFLVRPHPVERHERYAAWPTSVGYSPAELDPVLTGVAAVVGGPSTALLNLAAIHGRPAVRVSVPGHDLEQGLTDGQKGLLDRFTMPPDDGSILARLQAATSRS